MYSYFGIGGNGQPGEPALYQFCSLLYVKYSDLHVQSELDNCLRDDLAFE